MPAARVLSGMRTGVRENDREERSGGNGGLNSVSTSTSETSKVTNDEGHNGRVREQDLDRWKEDDEDDGFEVPAVNVVGSSRVMGEGDSEGLLKRERAKRAGEPSFLRAKRDCSAFERKANLFPRRYRSHFGILGRRLPLPT